MKEVYILRGLPGSGKSSLAKSLLSAGVNQTSCICSADDYFIDDTGKYNWDVTKLGKAHSWCKTLFTNCIKSEINRIIIDNTNTKYEEFKFYKDTAEEAGYTVFIITVGYIDPKVHEKYAQRNKHNVPLEKITQMANRFQI